MGARDYIEEIRRIIDRTDCSLTQAEDVLSYNEAMYSIHDIVIEWWDTEDN